MGQSRSIFVGLMVFASIAMPVGAQAQTVIGDQKTYGDAADLRGALSAYDFADKKSAQTSAKRRKVDPYTITGYDDGVFSLKPSLEIGAVASDNSYFTSASRAAGAGYVIKPSLNFATAWPVHEWTGSVGGSWTSFPTDTANDGFVGTALTDFRIDIRRGFSVNLEASAVVNETIAGQGQVSNSAVAARRDWTIGSNATVVKDFGPVQSSLKLGISRVAYGDVPLDNGAIIDNSALNYLEPVISLRGTLDLNHAALKPYAEISYLPRLHDINPDQRNSQGASAALGLTFNDGPIWQGDIAAVAMGRVYADQNLGTALNAGVAGNLTWSPTPLWTVVGTSSVALNESLLPNVAALPSWVIGINATYAVHENFFLHAGATFGLVGNGTGFDQTTGASVGADYMFTRHIGMTGTVQSTWINSSLSSSRDEQRVTLGVLLKP